MDDAVRSFSAAVEDAVSYINNTRKIALNPLTPNQIAQLTNSYFNGFNNIMDTDILLDKNQVKIGKYYFDALAVNSELCFGQHVQSSKINERFTSDDFKFHQVLAFVFDFLLSSRVHRWLGINTP